MYLDSKYLSGLTLAMLLLCVGPCLGDLDLKQNAGSISFTPSSKKDDLAVDFKTLLDKAEKGDVDAQEQVGVAYCNGNGVAQDYAQALIWLQKAADQKDLHATSWLGLLYANGFGVPRNQSMAFQYYMEAATKGNDAGDSMQIAQRYAEGNGVNASDVESLSWYAKAAAEGDPRGALEAGLDYFYGKGSTKDPEKAFRYFLQASYRDVAHAQYFLAYFYWNGIFVTRDPVQAYKWIQLANRRYHEDEATSLLKEITSSVTPAQAEQGQVLVDDWSQELRGQAPAIPLRATFTSGNSAKMPFESIDNEIVITTTINGNDKVKFILDTGAMMSVIDGICVSEYKIPRGSTYRSLSGIGKETVLGSRTADLSLALPGLTFDHISLDISPMSEKVDGLLGFDILSNFVIKFDYIAKTVEFMAADTFNPTDAGQLLPCKMAHSLIFIPAKLTNNHYETGAEDFVLDTGCSDGFVLSQHYMLSYPLLTFSKGWEGVAEGIGGDMWAERVPCFAGQVGEMPLKQPIVTVTKRDQGLFLRVNGLIGNEVWKNFDLTIDYPGKKVYLKPNSKYEVPVVAPPPITPAAKPSGPD